MPFAIGDILLKIDTRATGDTMLTRHHVMLVLGENGQGYPVVAHMMAYPSWKLVKEELTRGKDLKLIHNSWPEKTKLAIAKTAEEALDSNKFVINIKIIQEHGQAVSPFRPNCSLEAKRKLENLHHAFELESAESRNFTPTPETQMIMSCHQWVMSVIHYACRQTKTPIPRALQIPPHLAWADRLNYSSENDKSVSSNFITISSSLAPIAKPLVEKPLVATPSIAPPPKAPVTSTAVPSESNTKIQMMNSPFSFFNYLEKICTNELLPGILSSNNF
jgi:hypothetical protein